MIDKQFIVDDINDFLKPNNNKWKTYFDKSECKAILDAIEKSNKYEKMVNAWKEVLQELEELKEYVRGLNTRYYIGKSIGLEEAIDIIKQKLEIEE